MTIDWGIAAVICLALAAGIAIGYEAGKFVAVALLRSQGEDRKRTPR